MRINRLEIVQMLVNIFTLQDLFTKLKGTGHLALSRHIVEADAVALGILQNYFHRKPLELGQELRHLENLPWTAVTCEVRCLEVGPIGFQDVPVRVQVLEELEEVRIRVFKDWWSQPDDNIGEAAKPSPQLPPPVPVAVQIDGPSRRQLSLDQDLAAILQCGHSIVVVADMQQKGLL